MKSQALGQIKLDELSVRPEAEYLLQCAANEAYSEFKFGNWRTVVLWSRAETDKEGLVQEGDGTLNILPRAKGLSYINRLINDTFCVKRLNLVRAHILEDGVMIPHRDFLELGEAGNQWLRIHIPLQTNHLCLHSEERSVFHMRRGEIWILNAAMTHSACNLSNVPRISLCLDFDLAGQSVESVFRDLSQLEVVEPAILKREPLDAQFLESLLGLANILSASNYREILNLLARVHFYKEADINDFFVWIVEIADRSDVTELKQKFRAYVEFLRFRRSMGQRFSL